MKLGRYKHYKGFEYEALFLAKDSETLEEMVIYRALYGEKNFWVRSLKVFQELVTIEGKEKPRFLFLG